jgi:hypothetical protein
VPSPPPHDGLINGFVRPDATTAYVMSDHRPQPDDEHAGPGSVLIRTTDGGRSWQALGRLVPRSRSRAGSVLADRPLVRCLDNPASGAMQGKHLFRSSDGRQWSGDLGDMNAGAGGPLAVASRDLSLCVPQLAVAGPPNPSRNGTYRAPGGAGRTEFG